MISIELSAGLTWDILCTIKKAITTSVWNKAPSWISGRIEFHPSISSNTDLEHYKMSNYCKRRGSVPCSVIVLHVFRKMGKNLLFIKRWIVKAPYCNNISFSHGGCRVGCPKKPKSPNFVSQLTPVVFIG